MAPSRADRAARVALEPSFARLLFDNSNGQRRPAARASDRACARSRNPATPLFHLNPAGLLVQIRSQIFSCWSVGSGCSPTRSLCSAPCPRSPRLRGCLLRDERRRQWRVRNLDVPPALWLRPHRCLPPPRTPSPLVMARRRGLSPSPSACWRSRSEPAPHSCSASPFPCQPRPRTRSRGRRSSPEVRTVVLFVALSASPLRIVFLLIARASQPDARAPEPGPTPAPRRRP